MAVECEFIDFIIPIANINRVYLGGFVKFKADNIAAFSGRCWNDDYVFRDGAMNPMYIEYLTRPWTEIGLEPFKEVNGEKYWKDFCVVQGMFGGPTLKCEWLEFDSENISVFLKGKPGGEIIGRKI